MVSIAAHTLCGCCGEMIWDLALSELEHLEGFVGTERVCAFHIAVQRSLKTVLITLGWLISCSLHRTPNSASIKNKMMYSSSKDFFKGQLDGLSCSMQADDLSDISKDDMHQAVVSNLTRK